MQGRLRRRGSTALPEEKTNALTADAKEVGVENPAEETFRNQDSEKLGRRKKKSTDIFRLFFARR